MVNTSAFDLGDWYYNVTRSFFGIPMRWETVGPFDTHQEATSHAIEHFKKRWNFGKVCMDIYFGHKNGR